jgi:hypothetical protein
MFLNTSLRRIKENIATNSKKNGTLSARYSLPIENFKKQEIKTSSTEIPQ